MSHIDELTLMMYVDNELTTEESQQVTAHLSACSHCQEAYTLWKEDSSLFQHSFAEPVLPPTRIVLNTHVQQQVEAIASLHMHHKRKQFRQLSLWSLAASAFAVFYLFFVQNIVDQWLTSVWDSWKSQALWGSTFWLRDNIRDLVYAMNNYVYVLAVLFLALLIALFVLNYRRTPLLSSESTDGGMQQ